MKVETVPLARLTEGKREQQGCVRRGIYRELGETANRFTVPIKPSSTS